MHIALTPIILFTYNRPSHTKEVLSALVKCDCAEKSDLIIYLDGKKETATQQESQKINDVKSVLRTFEEKFNTYFNTIKIFEAKKNKGLAKSVREGITQQIRKHGKVIILEDDIVPQKGFLKFMNEALEKYKNEEKVWGISGCSYPLSDAGKVNESTFFLPVNSSWGWATWERTWNKINFDIEDIFQKFDKENVSSKEYNFGNYYYYQILEAQRKGKIDSWAALFNASMFLEEGLFLFPKHSLIQNIGFDTSGTHTTIEDSFFNTPQTEYVEISDIPFDLKSEGYLETKKAFQKQFGIPPLWRRMYNKLDSFLK